jgi:prepilin-type N-terminal cleavage/methylation domain-containing protein
MKTRNASAFTLIEMMVAVGIFGLLGTGLTMFYVESLKAANATEQQVRLMSDMRTFSNELFFNASRAHELILYATPTADDRSEAADRLLIVADEDTGNLHCPTGNLAVLVYYELPKPSTQAFHRIARIIAYSLDQSGTNPGVLTRLTIDLTASPSTNTVEQILTANWNTAARRIYGRLVTPLALSDGGSTSTAPRLFYKRSEQNLAICGQLLSNAGNRDSKDRHTVSRTMFFTVTTRS